MRKRGGCCCLNGDLSKQKRNKLCRFFRGQSARKMDTGLADSCMVARCPLAREEG